MKVINFLLFNFIVLYTNAKTYNCWNFNVPLKYGEIAFFQLGNYPAILPLYYFIFCPLKFILNEEIKEDSRLLYYFVELSNNTKSVYTFYGKQEIINNQLSFVPFIPLKKDVVAIAQHGYVIFEKNDKNSCPLESLSKDKPYQLNDESQILFLTNFIGNHKNNSYVSSCRWRFSSPEGYGFKVWINDYDSLKDGVELIVKNSTSIIMNHRTIEFQQSTKSRHPIYNSDNFIEISFNSIFPSSNTKLNISISLIKNEPKIVKQSCYSNNINDPAIPAYSTVFWGINYNHGYSNNAKCEYSFILPNNSLLYVEHGDFLLIDNLGDVIKVYIGDEEEERDVSNNGQYFVNIGPFEKDTKIRFKFTSDGSFQGLGFLLKIYILECKCNTKPINCDGSTNFYMEASETYCNKLACNFTFSHCPTEESLVTFFETSTIFERFRIYSDGEIHLDFVDYHEFISNFWTLINSSAENILEVIPLSNDNYQHERQNHPYGSERRFMFNLFTTPSDKPVLNITLSKAVSTQLLDMGLYKRVHFEVSPELAEQKNLTLTVYVSDLMYVDNQFFFQLFHNGKNILGPKCFDDLNPYICEIKENQFIAVQRRFPLSISPYLAVQTSEKFDNCLFDVPSVIVLKTYGPGAVEGLFNISQIASSNGSCDITLLVDLSYDDAVTNDKHFYISSVWTSAKEENVKVFFGSKNDSNLFFEFNQQNSSKFQFISLNSQGYTIEIPKSSSILIKIELSENYIPAKSFPPSSFQSLLTTPYFGGVKYPYNNSPLISTNHLFYFWGTDSDREMTFTIVYSDIFEDEEVYFLIDDKDKLQINSSFDGIIFNKNLNNSDSSNYITFFDDNIKLVYLYPPHPRPPKTRINNGIIFEIQYCSSIL